MEEKKQIKISLGTVICIVIIFVLIFALGITYYLGFVRDNEKETKTSGEPLARNNNTLQNTSDVVLNGILGEYAYQVPQSVKDEVGYYYDEVSLRLLSDNNFKLYCGGGFVLNGTFIEEENNVICNAKKITTDYLDTTDINVKYTFKKCANNTLELINKEGIAKYRTNNYGFEDMPTEIKEMKEVFEEVGSKFILVELDKDKVSESKVDPIAKELFEKGSKKIRESQYSEFDQYEKVQPLVEKTINGVKYTKRNVLYSDVEDEYLEIFTSSAFDNVLNSRFIEEDGYLYVSYAGATEWNITNIKLSRASITNDAIEYIVKYNNIEVDGSLSEEYSCKMTVDLSGKTYRISEINYCNIDKSY